MQLTDLNGKQIEVTNLDEAIRQAEMFMNFKHENPEYAQADEDLKNYWTDIYSKLLQLKNETEQSK